MKTLKFALIAAIVACTMVSLAYADGIKENPKFKKVVNMTFDQAMKIPGLVAAMNEQLDKDDFLDNTEAVYVASVIYNGSTYRIAGSRLQWTRFFKLFKMDKSYRYDGVDNLN